MESEQWFKDRKPGEKLMVALAEVTGACGRERSERPKRTRRGRK